MGSSVSPSLVRGAQSPPPLEAGCVCGSPPALRLPWAPPVSQVPAGQKQQPARTWHDTGRQDRSHIAQLLGMGTIQHSGIGLAWSWSMAMVHMAE